MKKAVVSCCLFFAPLLATSPELENVYAEHCQTPSDINEHISILRLYASECSSATEIGVRSLVSTWGLLCGLSDSIEEKKTYLGIDLQYPPADKLQMAKQLAQANGVEFQFLAANDMHIALEPVDLLFIDSLHTYCHLTYELETFSPIVGKYICLHDTSGPWGEKDDWEYGGTYSEYPPHIDRTKRGLWSAVVDFLESHPEWHLVERRLNNNGFTILKRDY